MNSYIAMFVVAIVVMFGFYIWIYRSGMHEYHSIREKGVKGHGQIINYEKPLTYPGGGGINIFSEHIVEVKFYIGKREIIAYALGPFWTNPGEVGDVIEIYWWENKPHDVVVDGKKFEQEYKALLVGKSTLISLTAFLIALGLLHNLMSS